MQVGIASVLAVPTPPLADSDVYVLPGSKDHSSLQLENPSSIPFDENELNIFNKMSELIESGAPGSPPTFDEIDTYLSSLASSEEVGSHNSVISDSVRKELNSKIVWNIPGTNASGHTLVFNEFKEHLIQSNKSFDFPERRVGPIASSRFSMLTRCSKSDRFPRIWSPKRLFGVIDSGVSTLRAKSLWRKPTAAEDTSGSVQKGVHLVPLLNADQITHIEDWYEIAFNS